MSSRSISDYSHLEGVLSRFDNDSMPEPGLVEPILATLLVQVKWLHITDDVL